MDANGTPYHLLLGRRDWLPIAESPDAHRLAWDPETDTIGLDTRPFPPLAHAPFDASTRRGAAFDAHGNLFWIDADEAGIRVQPCGTPRSFRLWSVEDLDREPEKELRPGDFRPKGREPVEARPRLRGLAVTTHQYLLVGTVEPAGLLIFDLPGGGPPEWLRWPEGLEFHPFDMTPTPDGGCVVLDRNTDDDSARLWSFDRHFRLRPLTGSLDVSPPRLLDFRPVGEERRTRPGAVLPLGFDLDADAPPVGADAIAVEALPDGSVLVLETPSSGASRLVRYGYAGRVELATLTSARVAAENSLIDFLRGHDFAFVPDADPEPGRIEGTLYIADPSGQQASALRLEADVIAAGAPAPGAMELRLDPRFLPLRGFSGRAFVRSGSEVYYDAGSVWARLLRQARGRYVRCGRTDRIVLDGGLHGTTWHRVFLDASIPDSTKVTIAARASDDEDAFEGDPWVGRPYRRAEGSELPFHQPFGDPEQLNDWTGTWELLLHGQQGRYLELRLVLEGDGRSSPRIRAMRVYAPRFSYLEQYLPAIYREDPTHGDFLDRFLANPEGLFTALEDRVASTEQLLDARTAPPEYLEWLAGWMGALMDPEFDEERQRLFLDHAHLLFRYRGTRAALLAWLRLALHPCPDASIFDELRTGRPELLGRFGGRDVRIVESFERRVAPGVALGDPTDLPGPRIVDTASEWQPREGMRRLDLVFVTYLAQRYGVPRRGDPGPGLKRLEEVWGPLGVPPKKEIEKPEDLEELLGYLQDRIAFAPVVPSDEDEARDWRGFVRDVLPHRYQQVTQDDLEAFQEFLERRYARVSALNRAWGRTGELAYDDFAAVELPTDAFPADGTPLDDWFDFVTRWLPLRRDAHSFVVLVPTELEDAPGERERRLARAAEIVRREKPVHTDFETRLYWALFRVGSARVGIDTVLGEGSRYTAVVLGATYLGEGFVPAADPWNRRDRFIIGRDRMEHHR